MLFFLTSTMYRCIIIAFGVLYPAFNSYKSLSRRDGYEQVKWIMYWIVFAAFMACEVITDLFFSWLPLYNEAKILFVLWMVLPMTRGSSFLYRKIIHPNLLKHESEIDSYIAKASSKGCEVLFQFGQHGMNLAATAVLKTADHLKRSYSVEDIFKSNASVQQRCKSNLSISHEVENTNSQTNLTEIFTNVSMNLKTMEEETGLNVPKSKRNTRTAKKPTSDLQQLIDSSTSSLDPVRRRAKKVLHKVNQDL